jgi:hypothetical protein
MTGVAPVSKAEDLSRRAEAIAIAVVLIVLLIGYLVSRIGGS